MITEFAVKSDYTVRKINGQNTYNGTVSYIVSSQISGMINVQYLDSPTIRISKSISMLENIRAWAYEHKSSLKNDTFNTDYMRINISGQGGNLLYGIAGELISEIKASQCKAQ